MLNRIRNYFCHNNFFVFLGWKYENDLFFLKNDQNQKIWNQKIWRKKKSRKSEMTRRRAIWSGSYEFTFLHLSIIFFFLFEFSAVIYCLIIILDVCTPLLLYSFFLNRIPFFNRVRLNRQKSENWKIERRKLRKKKYFDPQDERNYFPFSLLRKPLT